MSVGRYFLLAPLSKERRAGGGDGALKPAGMKEGDLEAGNLKYRVVLRSTETMFLMGNVSMRTAEEWRFISRAP